MHWLPTQAPDQEVHWLPTQIPDQEMHWLQILETQVTDQ
jgi:hypothetical protein